MPVGSRGYDAELQMFVDTPREPDPARLLFLRWLGEQGQLEHQTEGEPIGEYADLDLSKQLVAVAERPTRTGEI